MPEIVPPWLLGEDLTLVTIQGCTRANDGTLTPGSSPGSSSFSVHGSIDAVRLATDTQHAIIRPVSRRQLNNVITGDGAGVTLVEILKRNESILKNFLALLAFSFDYFKIVFTRGPNTWTGFFVRGNFTDGVSDHGENTAEMSFLPVDVGTLQVAYSTP